MHGASSKNNRDLIYLSVPHLNVVLSHGLSIALRLRLE